MDRLLGAVEGLERRLEMTFLDFDFPLDPLPFPVGLLGFELGEMLLLGRQLLFELRNL